MAHGKYLHWLINSAKKNRCKSWNHWRKRNPAARISLNNADLHGVDLSNANLSGISFCKANLSVTNLSSANLSNANFQEANLRGADFSLANLQGANFHKANLGLANFIGASLGKTNFAEARLKEADFSGADLSESDMTKANLSKAELVGARLYKCDLQGSNLHKSNLSKADMRLANLDGVDLQSANLAAVDLREAMLNGSKLSHANISEANLKQAQLCNATLVEANLYKCELSEANLKGADLTDANLKQAILRKVHLHDVCLNGVDLNGAVLHRPTQKVKLATDIHCKYLYFGDSIGEKEINFYDDDNLNELVEYLTAPDKEFDDLYRKRVTMKTLAEQQRESQEYRKVRDYQILSKIAEGSVGIVYAARDERTGEKVALKILKELDSDALGRFRRETEIGSQLRHKNIVNIRDFGEEQGTYFMVMDLIIGKPLSTYKPQGIEESVAICSHLCGALQYIHAKNIFHRDIKPDNILMDLSTDPPTPKLTDFSLAVRDTPLEIRFTLTGDIMGTPLYMSPEQAKGDQDCIDWRTDIYSLGAVFYELLTQKPPFKGSKFEELYTKILHDAPIPPSRLHKMRKDLDLIVLTALSKSPSNRYRSATEMFADLQAFARNEQPSYCRSEFSFWLDAHKAIVKIVALLTLSLLLIIGGLIYKFVIAPEVSPVTIHMRKAQQALLDKKFHKAMEEIKILELLAPKAPEVVALKRSFASQIKKGKFLRGMFSEIENLYFEGNQLVYERISKIPPLILDANRARKLFDGIYRTNFQQQSEWNSLVDLEKLRPIYFISSKTVFAPKLFQAICKLQLGHVRESWALLEQISKSNSPLFLYFRGKARLYMGGWKLGLADLQAFTVMVDRPQTDNVPLLYSLGTGERQKLAMSIAKLQQAAHNVDRFTMPMVLKFAQIQNNSLIPNQQTLGNWEKLARKHIPGAYVYIGIVYSKINNTDAALQNFTKALQAGVPYDYIAEYEMR